MIDDIFIKYANCSLKDNPGTLLDLYREFAESGYVRFSRPYLKDAHEMIFIYYDKFTKFENYSDALEAYNELKNEILNKYNRQHKKNEWIYRLKIGFNGVWACASVGCDNCANYLPFLRFKLMANHNRVIYGPNRIRCQECNQLEFRYILESISKGIDWNNYTITPIIYGIISHSTKFIRTQYSPDHEDGYSIVKENIYDPDLDYVVPLDNLNEKDMFFYLTTHDFIGLSLAKFLHENGRRKLRYCEECTSFYISKTKRNQRFCSNQCRLSYHNRRRIESGEHARYKRERKKKGKATASYYG